MSDQRPFTGKVACRADDIDIMQHAELAYCPAGQFEKPEGWNATSLRPPLPVVELSDEQIEEERRRLAAGGCCGEPVTTS